VGSLRRGGELEGALEQGDALRPGWQRLRAVEVGADEVVANPSVGRALERALIEAYQLVEALRATRDEAERRPGLGVVRVDGDRSFAVAASLGVVAVEVGDAPAQAERSRVPRVLGEQRVEQRARARTIVAVPVLQVRLVEALVGCGRGRGLRGLLRRVGLLRRLRGLGLEAGFAHRALPQAQFVGRRECALRRIEASGAVGLDRGAACGGLFGDGLDHAGRAPQECVGLGLLGVGLEQQRAHAPQARDRACGVVERGRGRLGRSGTRKTSGTSRPVAAKCAGRPPRCTSSFQSGHAIA
jgi:hypothetical protein